MSIHIKDMTFAVIIFFTANVVYGVETLVSKASVKSDLESLIAMSQADNLHLRIEPASEVQIPISQTVHFYSDQVHVSLCVVTMYQQNLRVEIAQGQSRLQLRAESLTNLGSINSTQPQVFRPACNEDAEPSFTLKQNENEKGPYSDRVTLVISPE